MDYIFFAELKGLLFFILLPHYSKYLVTTPRLNPKSPQARFKVHYKRGRSPHFLLYIVHLLRI